MDRIPFKEGQVNDDLIVGENLQLRILEMTQKQDVDDYLSTKNRCHVPPNLVESY